MLHLIGTSIKQINTVNDSHPDHLDSILLGQTTLDLAFQVSSNLRRWSFSTSETNQHLTLLPTLTSWALASPCNISFKWVKSSSLCELRWFFWWNSIRGLISSASKWRAKHSSSLLLGGKRSMSLASRPLLIKARPSWSIDCSANMVLKVAVANCSEWPGWGKAEGSGGGEENVSWEYGYAHFEFVRRLTILDQIVLEKNLEDRHRSKLGGNKETYSKCQLVVLLSGPLVNVLKNILQGFFKRSLQVLVSTNELIEHFYVFSNIICIFGRWKDTKRATFSVIINYATRFCQTWDRSISMTIKKSMCHFLSDNLPRIPPMIRISNKESPYFL